ncbi:MAG TPA: hypothetical protein PKD84_03790 [Propionicimonas sp.]|nr:hypothetical protein [Propionicimonas sp.]
MAIRPGRIADMVFDLPGGRVAVEYDAFYFHPDPDDDAAKTSDILASGQADLVVRIRETPLPTLSEFDLAVPTRPDPQLCALLLVRHLQHLTDGRLLDYSDPEACYNFLPRLDFVPHLEHEYVTKKGYAGFEGCSECLASLHDCHDSYQPADLSLVQKVLGEDWH